jgi:hypothetical protein
MIVALRCANVAAGAAVVAGGEGASGSARLGILTVVGAVYGG